MMAPAGMKKTITCFDPSIRDIKTNGRMLSVKKRDVSDGMAK